jgi:hypothetical protein
MGVETPTRSSNVVDFHCLVLEKRHGFYSRVGEAEISGPPVFREKRRVRLR